MRLVTRLIGALYGLAAASNLVGLALFAAPAGMGWASGRTLIHLAILVVTGLIAILLGLSAYALVTLKPWGRWPITLVNLLYLLLGLAFLYKPAAVPHLVAAALLGVTWWSWQPGFPVGPLRFATFTRVRGAMSASLLAMLALLLALVGFEAQRDLRRCAQEFGLDGRAGCVTPLFFREDTEYAPGYSAAAFAQLRVGMSEREVRALLGPPLEGDAVPSSGAAWWLWTRSPGSNSYRVRGVVFIDGRVAAVHHKFYVD
jgi:hypothetical protein